LTRQFADSQVEGDSAVGGEAVEDGYGERGDNRGDPGNRAPHADESIWVPADDGAVMAAANHDAKASYHWALLLRPGVGEGG
jgi:hypothetical protein